MISPHTVSAPGKLLLFGEHAAVYGYPSIVSAVSSRLFVSVEDNPLGTLTIDAPQSANTRFVEAAIENTLQHLHTKKIGLTVHTHCPFSGQYGFGSSSAVTVATVYAVLAALEKDVPLQDVFSISYKTVLEVQKTGSGFDVAAATFGGTIWYEQFGKTIAPLPLAGNPEFIVGYSGVKADTVSIVQSVRAKKEREEEKVTRIFEAIAKIVKDARVEIAEGDWERVGVLMNFNQEYLRDLGVSTQKLEDMIMAAKNAGAYGAKLSGAGGGDCMIALASEGTKQAVIDAIHNAGGQVIDVSLDAPGVRIEETHTQA